MIFNTKVRCWRKATEVIVLVGCAYWGTSALGAATLQGHVYNSVTGLTVENALIRVLGSTNSSETQANGFFSIVDIPAGAIAEDSVELLITKDGFHPETIRQRLDSERSSVSIRPKETLVDVWLNRLKNANNVACASRMRIVEVISNLGVDNINLKTDAIDALLSISTRYNFRFSVAETFAADYCLESLNNGAQCSGSSSAHTDSIPSTDSDDESEQWRLAFIALQLMLECIRPDERMEQIAGELLELLFEGPVIVRSVDDSSIGARVGLQPGDVIVRYDDQNISSIDEWNELTESNQEERNVVLDILRQGTDELSIVVPSGDLGILVGTAKASEIDR